MNKKKWSISIITVGLIALLNINHMYIAIVKPMVFPYPPFKALKNEEVVIYGEVLEVNSKKKLQQFVESFEKKQVTKVTLTFYEEEPRLFSKYFLTIPIQRFIIEYNGNDIILTDVSSDMITEMEYRELKVIHLNGYQIFRLIDKSNEDYLDLVTILSSQ